MTTQKAITPWDKNYNKLITLYGKRGVSELILLVDKVRNRGVDIKRLLRDAIKQETMKHVTSA